MRGIGASGWLPLNLNSTAADALVHLARGRQNWDQYVHGKLMPMPVFLFFMLFEPHRKTTLVHV